MGKSAGKQRPTRLPVTVYGNALERDVVEVTSGYVSDSSKELWSWEVECDQLFHFDRLLCQPTRLTDAQLNSLPPLVVNVGDTKPSDGIPSVFGVMSGEWFLASEEFKRLMEAIAANDVCFYPVRCIINEKSKRELGGMYIMHVLTEVDCVNISKSHVTILDDGTRIIAPYAVDLDRIPSHAQVFRPKHVHNIVMRSRVVEKCVESQIKYLMVWPLLSSA